MEQVLKTVRGQAQEHGGVESASVTIFNGNLNVSFQDGFWNSFQMPMVNSYEEHADRNEAMKAELKTLGAKRFNMPKFCL